jgi:hypothetical protein
MGSQQRGQCTTLFVKLVAFAVQALDHHQGSGSPEDSQRTRFTRPRAPAGLLRPLLLRFFVMRPAVNQVMTEGTNNMFCTMKR